MNPQYINQLFSLSPPGVNSLTNSSLNIDGLKMTPTGKISRKYKSPEERKKGDPGRWTADEHMRFLQGLKLYGRNWKEIAELVRTRSVIQIRTHAQKYQLKEKKAREAGHAGAVMMDGKGILSPMEMLIRDTERLSKQALKQEEKKRRKDQRRLEREELKKIKQQERKMKRQKKNNQKKEDPGLAPLNVVATSPSAMNTDALSNYNQYNNFPMALEMPLNMPNALNFDDVHADVFSLVNAGLLSQANNNSALNLTKTDTRIHDVSKQYKIVKTAGQKKSNSLNFDDVHADVISLVNAGFLSQTNDNSALSLKKPDTKVHSVPKQKKVVKAKVQKKPSSTNSTSQKKNNIVSLLDNKEKSEKNLPSTLLFKDSKGAQGVNLPSNGNIPRTLHSSIPKSPVMSPLTQPTIMRKLSVEASTSGSITTDSANASLGPTSFSDSINSVSSTYSAVTKKLNYFDNFKTNILELETPEVKILDIDFHQSFHDDLRLTDINPLQL